MRWLLLAGSLALIGLAPARARACSCDGSLRVLGDTIPLGWPIAIRAGQREQLEGLEIRDSDDALVPHTVEFVTEGDPLAFCGGYAAFLWADLAPGRTYTVESNPTSPWEPDIRRNEVTVLPSVSEERAPADTVEYWCFPVDPSLATNSCSRPNLRTLMQLIWRRPSDGPMRVLQASGLTAGGTRWSYLWGTTGEAGTDNLLLPLWNDALPPDRWELITYDGNRISFTPRRSEGDCYAYLLADPPAAMPHASRAGCSAAPGQAGLAGYLLLILAAGRRAGARHGSRGTLG